jgi:hypothetical protein
MIGGDSYTHIFSGFSLFVLLPRDRRAPRLDPDSLAQLELIDQRRAAYCFAAASKSGDSTGMA